MPVPAIEEDCNGSIKQKMSDKAPRPRMGGVWATLAKLEGRERRAAAVRRAEDPKALLFPEKKPSSAEFAEEGILVGVIGFEPTTSTSRT